MFKVNNFFIACIAEFEQVNVSWVGGAQQREF